MNGTNDAGEGRVLVVDDTESKRYVLATWLRRAGYDVVEAKSGKEALEVAASQPIAIVVLDVNLPDMSGYAVCERIKAEPRTASVPVLHVSAVAIGSTDRSQGLRRGADSYLAEPIEREELVATVEALLRGAAAQRTALRLARQLRALHDATLAVNQANGADDLLTTIVDEARGLFESRVTLAVVVEDRAILAVSAPGAGTAVRPSTVEDVDAMRRHAGAGAQTLVAELEDSGVRGMLVVEQTPVPAEEARLILTQFARASSTAIAKMRTYAVERRIALMLQRSLLPESVPRIRGLDVAVRYEASAVEAEVGGDFYELFSIGDDAFAFAVGDVAGHSLEAAAVMAQLRTGIRSYMLEGHGPAASLERLNRLLLRFHPGTTATVCCGIWELSSGRVELANAGHLPPLLVHGAGAEYLPLGGTLLGIEAPAAAAHVFTVAPGDVLLLFTDGLVERRYELIDDGLERLARVAQRGSGDVDALCDRVLREAGPKSIADDIALVAIRRNVQDR